MKLSRRQFLPLAAGAVSLPAISRMAGAQAYPARPVRLVVGFAAGGLSDTVARIMGQWLSERLGRPVIVENKTGGGTNIAVQSVVNSPPDGYTLLFVSSSNAANTTFYEKLPFDLQQDIAPVCGVASFPLVMVVNPSVPARTVSEFIAYAKATPDKITMASFGTGTTSHLLGELVKATAGVNMVHVPYRGEAPALIDLIAGRVQVMFATVSSSMEHVRAGTLRALAVSTATRWNGLLETPTLGETFPGLEATSWYGIGVPKGTSPEIVARLAREIDAGLTNSGIKARLAELNTTPMILTSGEFGALIATDTEKWGKVIRAANIKAE
jgi:tripartite-type tricarboxylate transporter receptor subunit TctC